jgi:hypothetical protein
MGNSFYYSFDTKEVINPLDQVTHFYVNPYMPESARLLNLVEKASDKAAFEVDWVNGLPVVLFPISILKLSTVIVTISSEDKIVVKKNNTKLYMKLTDNPEVVRIDSVFC